MAESRESYVSGGCFGDPWDFSLIDYPIYSFGYNRITTEYTISGKIKDMIQEGYLFTWDEGNLTYCKGVRDLSTADSCLGSMRGLNNLKLLKIESIPINSISDLANKEYENNLQKDKDIAEIERLKKKWKL